MQRVGQQFSLSGALPYQTEVSVDGILTTSVRRNGIGAEGINVFPSIESIEEIKVSSVSNTAEYLAAGRHHDHLEARDEPIPRTAFHNFNNTGLNANPNYFNKSVAPNQSDNSNYGFSIGGPAARGRTFFFGTFERLDISRTQSAAATVPSEAFRDGDFSSVATPILDPSTGHAFPETAFPRHESTRSRRIAADIHSGAERRTSIHRYSVDGSEVSNQFESGSTRISVRVNAVRQVQPQEGRHAGADDVRKPGAANRGAAQSHAGDLRQLRDSPEPPQRSALRPDRADQTFTTGQRGIDIIGQLGLTLLSTNPPDVTGTPSVQIAGYTNFGESQEEPLTQDNWQFADT